LAFPLGSEIFERQRALLMDEGVFVKGKSTSIKKYGWKPDLGEILFLLEN
jgi:alkylated DNA nucleotide flippase Atl1